MKRTLYADILLADGRHSEQRFPVEGNKRELDALADIFAKGVLSALALIEDDEIQHMNIGWAELAHH